MFSMGTHANRWTYESECELNKSREKANRTYINNYISSEGCSRPDFLSPCEEKVLCRYFEFTLHEFCKKFKPPMPKSVIGCSFHYYKRFYLNNSVMDYHPKHIIVTCVFLACKVEEFNVSIMQFVANVKGDREKAKEIILSNELLLMQQLEYNLVVHHPYRPVEGFLIDIKTRCPEVCDPEQFRHVIDEFLDCICFTDLFLLYAPSQIALAAVVYASSKFKENVIKSYVTEALLSSSSVDHLPYVKSIIKKICSMAKNIGPPPREQVKTIEKKLEKCRNEDNNPNSVAYKRKLKELQDDDEQEQTRKYIKLEQKRNQEDQEILGMIHDASVANG